MKDVSPDKLRVPDYRLRWGVATDIEGQLCSNWSGTYLQRLIPAARRRSCAPPLGSRFDIVADDGVWWRRALPFRRLSAFGGRSEQRPSSRRVQDDLDLIRQHVGHPTRQREVRSTRHPKPQHAFSSNESCA